MKHYVNAKNQRRETEDSGSVNTQSSSIESSNNSMENQLSTLIAESMDSPTLDLDFSTDLESTLPNNSFIEIYPADILHPQNIFKYEDNSNHGVIAKETKTQQSGNLTGPTTSETTEAAGSDSKIAPEHEFLITKQVETVNSDKTTVTTAKSQGYHSTRTYLTIPSIGRPSTSRQTTRQTFNSQTRPQSQEKRARTNHTLEPTKRACAYPSTSSKAPKQEEECRTTNAAQSSAPRLEARRLRPQNFRFTHPYGDVPTRFTLQNSAAVKFYQVMPSPPQPANIVHPEGECFIAKTLCWICKNEKEYVFSSPGQWPPPNCVACGNKWCINDWSVYDAKNTDEVIYAGEVINNNRPRVPRLPPQYGLDGIKIEPQDDFSQIPQCRKCGGRHTQRGGHPQNPIYCPFYNGTFY